MVSSLVLFILRTWDVYILLVFPRDYICAYRMKIIPVVVSIVFCYQKYMICNKAPPWTYASTSGYKRKHKLKGAV